MTAINKMTNKELLSAKETVEKDIASALGWGAALSASHEYLKDLELEILIRKNRRKHRYPSSIMKVEISLFTPAPHKPVWYVNTNDRGTAIETVIKRNPDVVAAIREIDVTYAYLHMIGLSDILEPSKPFQDGVKEWIVECLGAEIAGDTTNRAHRFFEEATELSQAAGCTIDDAKALVDHVFGKPVGELEQEVGGVMLTLAALCNAFGTRMDACGNDELKSAWLKKDKIRAKAKSAIPGSPLPGTYQDTASK